MVAKILIIDLKLCDGSVVQSGLNSPAAITNHIDRCCDPRFLVEHWE